MSDNDNLEYKLPQSAYVNFDASSLKTFMIEKLNNNSTFTDQIYEGSNLSSMIEILAYFTHVLLFYSNQNSTEALFDQATIYENMNRIVKLIGYNPTGKQTSLSPVTCTASADLDIGSYKLRKYSYFLVDNIQYSVIDDHTFEKSTTESESIESINEGVVLYQGSIQEYPSYIADGDAFEGFPIVVDNLVDTDDDRFISHGSISVYVKEVNSGLWKEYTEIDTLYLSPSTARIYEIRLNENGHYELKFGNDTFGRKLVSGDEVKVFYLLSDALRGIISKGAINGNRLYNYTSPTFNAIYNDISTDSSEVISLATSSKLTFTNPDNSTPIHGAETVEDIRNNTPQLIASQYRLVTESDYEAIITKSLPNIVSSVKVVNNDSFLNDYIAYYYDICVDPNKANRVLINQVNFSDTCDFNNVNVFCVPQFNITKDGSYPPFLSESFKGLIVDLTNDKKMISHEVVPRDPLYIAFDIGISNGDTSTAVADKSKLVIVRESNNKINKTTLKNRVSDIIIEFFKPSNNTLGGLIDLSTLTTSILSLEGVKSIRTTNSDDGITYNGVSFLSWNPLYSDADSSIFNQSTTLPYYKFPYFYSPQSLITKIEVIDA